MSSRELWRIIFIGNEAKLMEILGFLWKLLSELGKSQNFLVKTTFPVKYYCRKQGNQLPIPERGTQCIPRKTFHKSCDGYCRYLGGCWQSFCRLLSFVCFMKLYNENFVFFQITELRVKAIMENGKLFCMFLIRRVLLI